MMHPLDVFMTEQDHERHFERLYCILTARFKYYDQIWYIVAIMNLLSKQGITSREVLITRRAQ